MPTIESAKKRVKTAEKKRKQNLKWKNKMKEAIKEMEAIIENGEREKAEEKLSETYQIIDKAAKHNIIPDNRADRKKSKLARQINEL